MLRLLPSEGTRREANAGDFCLMTSSYYKLVRQTSFNFHIELIEKYFFYRHHNSFILDSSSFHNHVDQQLYVHFEFLVNYHCLCKSPTFRLF